MFIKSYRSAQNATAIISIIILLSLLNSHAVSAFFPGSYEVTCAGIEVMGVSHDTAEQVRKFSTMQVGDKFNIDDTKPLSDKAIKNIKENLSIGDIETSFMVVSNGELYMILDIIPNEAKSTTYRTIPDNPEGVVRLTKELMSLYNRHNDRKIHFMQNYTNFEEYYDKGYLDYDDPVLHSITEQLRDLAKEQNDDLLKIIHYSHDEEEREAAALLLSWSQHPSNLTYIAKADILRDPNVAVRNNVARSYIHFMDRVEDKAILEDIIPAYCEMAALPSHSDRNKALYCILGILKAHPDLAVAVNLECTNNINYIAEMSILDNVGGVAKEIINLLGVDHNLKHS